MNISLIEHVATGCSFTMPAGVLVLRRPTDGDKPEVQMVTKGPNGQEQVVVLARVQRSAEQRAFQIWCWAFGQLRQSEMRASMPWWKPWKKIAFWQQRRKALRAQQAAPALAPAPPQSNQDAQDTPIPIKQ